VDNEDSGRNRPALAPALAVAVPFSSPYLNRVSESAALAPEPSYLSGLNAPQREAVLTTEGPVLVLAGAGTGKTAALTARLAHLIATRRAWPSEILAVTFTNKAAREMRERINRISGGAIEGMPWLGTFHSIAAKMLRIHAELAGLQSNFTILDTDDQLRLLKQLIVAAELEEQGSDPRPGRCRRGGSLCQRPRRRSLCAISEASAGPERLRFRRSPAAHAGHPPHPAGRARALSHPLQISARGRISGHERRPV
jgi:hypothetical protein